MIAIVGGAAAARGNPFAAELSANPLTVALLKKERKFDEIVIATEQYPVRGPIFLALLPGMNRLMALIHDPWVGGRPMLPDGLPVLDTVPTARNAFVATGHVT